VRLAALSFAFALACAASSSAAQSGRVRRAEPAATPEQKSERPEGARAQGGGRAVTGEATGDGDGEPDRDEAGGRIYPARQVDQKARLLSRPQPAYPRRARRNEVRGTVRLRVVLAASGKVEKISVIRGLPDGVTEEAIKAARAIRFVPAERDGRKVSQWAIIEYNFQIY
jgi:TonB family protein